MGLEVVVIDAGVQDADNVLAGLSADVHVVRLEAGRDGVLQLAEALAGLDDVSTLHIVSHGGSGALALGSARLDSTTLADYADAWAQLRAALSDDADLLLYGCNVADGATGARFLRGLSDWTGADVAASTDLTGAGGDWVLERRLGRIESTALQLSAYAWALDTLTGTSGNDTLTGTFDADQLSGLAGDDSLSGLGGTDTLYGSDGADVLNGGAGADTMNGGRDDDLYVVDTLQDLIEGEQDWGGYYYSYSSGWDTVQTALAYTLPTNVEALQLTGAAAASGTGNTADNAITGNGVANALYGLDGADTLNGGAGNDALDGGDGSDTASYAGAGTAVTVRLSVVGAQATGGAGSDTLVSIENLLGSSFNDSLAGNAEANVLSGSLGGDTLNGAGGNDTLDGGAGTDLAVFSGAFSGYRFGWRADGHLQVEDTNAANGDSGTDFLRNIDTLNFGAQSLGVIEGGEFRVNTRTVGDQSGSAVATLADGSYVVVWQGPESNPQTGRTDLYAQRYAANGDTLGIEFRVNQTTAGNQADAAVSMLADGGFVVAWSSIDDSGYGVFLRRFNANGVALSGDIQVNSYTDSTQYLPAVTSLGEDGFVVAWQSYGQDANGYAVIAQRFDADGQKAGGEFQLNQYTTSSQQRVTLTGLEGGGFVASWESYGQDGAGSGVYARIFDAGGSALADEFQVSSATLGEQTTPRITAVNGGGFVVAWQLYDTVSFDYDIWVRRYDAAGISLGEFRVNLTTTSIQYEPAIASLANGGFVVVWRSNHAGSDGYDIYARHFDANGVALSNEIRVATTNADFQHQPEVTGTSDGGFLVTWSALAQDGSSYGIFARQFDQYGIGSQLALQGTAAADVLDISGPGGLAAAGGAGNDLYRVNGADDSVRENAGQGHDTVEASADYTLSAEVEDLVLLEAAGDSRGTGNPGDNRLTGNSVNNTLNGGAGNDTLDGGAGADQMDGGFSGDDVYYVDNALDTITGEAFWWYYSYYNSGFDTVYSSVDRTLEATIEDLVLTGAAAQGTGNSYNNRITGNAGANTLAGGTGNDSLVGGLGDDRIDGGDGIDTAIYSAAAGPVTLNLGNADAQNTGVQGTDTLLGIENAIGGASSDSITGSDAANRLEGGGGGDVLAGGIGNDTLDGGSGADTLDGASGDDTYIVDSALDQILLDEGGTEQVMASVSWTLAAGLENLSLTGNGAIGGRGNSVANLLIGNAANNSFVALEGDDTVRGGAGNDAMNGGLGADSLSGESGADQLVGAGGDDVVDGGGGVDLAGWGGNSPDYRFGVAGDGRLLVTDLNTTGADDGTDTLSNIETLKFLDKSYLLRGGEIQLNTTVTGNQFDPVVVALDDGGYLATWASYSYLTGRYDIFAQAMDAQGAPVGTEQQVSNGVSSLYNLSPAAARLGDGSVVISWQAYLPDGSGYGVYARRFGADGTAMGSELLVNTTTADHQLNPAIASLANGGYVVAWMSLGQDGSGYGIYAQRFTAAGAKLGTEQLVTQGTVSDQADVAVERLGNGYVVTWRTSDETQDGSFSAVMARAFAGTGAALTDEYQLNQASSGGQQQPQAAALSANLIVHVWMDPEIDGSGYAVQARLFDAAGNGVSDQFTVNLTVADIQTAPQVTALSGGGFVVVWQSQAQDGSGYGIYARRFNNSGEGVGGEFRVNTTTASDQVSPTVDALANGGFVVAWQSNNQDGEAGSIHAQQFDASGQPVTREIRGTGAADRIDISGPGALAAAGGAGNDTYVVDDNQLDRINEIAGQGIDKVLSLVDWTLSETLENLELLAGVNGVGNSQNNSIKGNSSSNSLSGGAGNDTLDGGTGSDTLVGGFGNDLFYVRTAGDDVVEGVDEGIDTASVSINGYALDANVDNLVLTGTGNFAASGNGLANQITGNSGNNSLSGGAGNDTLTGGSAGTDTLNGGLGNDTFTYRAGVTLQDSGGTDTVRVTGSFTLAAGFEYLVLQGTGNFNGTGNGAANRLTGNAGNNLLNGGAGVDTLIGGAGNDTFVVDNAADVVTEALNGGYDTVRSSAINVTLAANVEALELIGSNAENATGNGGNNAITGNAIANRLDGGLGADTLTGGRGDDIYIVDVAGDVVVEIASEGDDVVQSAVTYTLGDNVEDLFLTGSANINGYGNDDENNIEGNDGNNLLDGGVGVDRLVGKGGNDRYYVDQTADTVIEEQGGGTDTVYAAADYTLGLNVERLIFLEPGGGPVDRDGIGNASGNLIVGGAGDDELNGLGGNDTLRGLGGDDTLSGGAGDDSMEGGTGDDTYEIDSSGDVYLELAGGGSFDHVRATVSHTLGAQVEYLSLEGTADIDGTGNLLGNVMEGNSGANNLNGAGGDDKIEGGEGSDTILGGAGNDTMYGGSMDQGPTGDVDVMQGGDGDDVYYVDNEADDTIELDPPDGDSGSPSLLGAGGHPGPDAVGTNIDTVLSQVSYTLRANIENLQLEGSANLAGTGNELANLLAGNGGNNHLRGLAGIDILDGGGGADTLEGGAGADTLGGGNGNDTYIVAGNDALLEFSNQGNDTVQVGVAWTLANHFENLVLTGGNDINGNGNGAANTLTGNSGRNQLKGQAGNDTLLGLGGNDTLAGGGGNDTLTGGAGVDVFVFDTGLSSTENLDQITDFLPGTDRLRLSADWFTRLAGQTTLNPGQFYAAAGANAAHDANDVIIYNTNTGALFYDPDGQGGLGAIQFARLNGAPAGLAATDFVISG